MKQILKVALLLGVLSTVAPAAVVLSVTATPAQVGPSGGPVEAVVSISGLGDFTAPSLGNYDLILTYEPTVLQFDSVAYGDAVLGNMLDLTGFGTLQFDMDMFGSVNVFEISLDDIVTLETLQPGAFSLFTVSFNPVGQGYSPLVLSVNSIGDALGDPLTPAIQSATVTVVPEPSSFLLVGAALGGLAFLRRIRAAQ